MQQRKKAAIKAAVKKHGIEAVNSDEELNGILDEAQQERFIRAMHAMASDYIHTWRQMFSWLSILVCYINILAFCGSFPFLRSFFTSWVPKSVTVGALVSPIWLLSGFFGSTIPLIIHASSLLTIFHIMTIVARHQTPGLSRRIRGIGLTSLVVWGIISNVYIEKNWYWGKHIVVCLSLPLMCIAADTFVSARDLAIQGIDKLSALKYSHKKV
jgi:hypothetical protein